VLDFFENSNVLIQPNPSDDFIIVKGISQRLNYRICNQLGEIVSVGEYLPGTKIKTDMLMSGFYILIIESYPAKGFFKK
jgi:hypothetical protein